jgi:hypothetical protein
MARGLYVWALEERVEITEQIKWFNAGAVLTSPSGDDITTMRLAQLKERLEELDEALREADNASASS